MNKNRSGNGALSRFSKMFVGTLCSVMGLSTASASSLMSDMKNLGVMESRIGKVHLRGESTKSSASYGQSWISSLQVAGNHICGAALVNPQWVLTAAHCVSGDQFSESLATVVVGSNDLQLVGNDQTFSVEDVIVHPGYDGGSFENDVALIRLTQEVKTVEPVSIFANASLSLADSDWKVVTESGWGALSEYAGSVDVLHDVELLLASDESCSAVLTERGGSGTRKICTSLAEDAANACDADGGSPLWINMDGDEYLIGVVSRHIDCAPSDEYAVYSSSIEYRGWISQIMAGNATINSRAMMIPRKNDKGDKGGKDKKGDKGDKGDNEVQSQGPVASSENNGNKGGSKVCGPAEVLYRQSFELERSEFLTEDLGRSYFQAERIEVPEGVVYLRLTLSGPSNSDGYLDLFVAYERYPGIVLENTLEVDSPYTTNYDYASQYYGEPSVVRNIEINNPKAGDWMYRAYTGNLPRGNWTLEVEMIGVK